MINDNPGEIVSSDDEDGSPRAITDVRKDALDNVGDISNELETSD